MTVAHTITPVSTFDRIWPEDGKSFVELLNADELQGAEDRYGVTPFAVSITRSFCHITYDNEDRVDDLRQLLRTASTMSLDSPWARRLICSMLDEAISIQDLADDPLAQITWIKRKHLGGVTSAADWRFERQAALVLADASSDSVDKQALEAAAALAWPRAAAAKAAGDALPILCFAKAQAAARDAGAARVDPIEYDRLFNTVFRDMRAARDRKAPALASSPIDLFAPRHPGITRLRVDEERFEWSAARTVCRRLLAAVAREERSFRSLT